MKAASNRLKHGVGFELAARVFADAFAMSEPERIEDGEQRWRTIGMIAGTLVLTVAHTVWFEDDDEVIRIISARRATAHERRRYEENRR